MSWIPRLRDSGNHLLDRLPVDEFEILAPMLQSVSLSLKQVVYQHQSDITHVHFPTTALISLLTVMEEDDPVEATTVGREGCFGTSTLLGVEASPFRAICQMAGESLRVSARSLLEVLPRCPSVSRLIHRYIVFTSRNIGQGIACNTLHNVDSRTCRWLLRVHDQAGRDEFPMTQEFLAFMLGVRRQSVTVVAGTLQNAGLISYRRGTIVIRDRVGLEDAACECYGVMQNYYEQIMMN
ncbi:Crp/Fnr family transcriptional regulator [Singulisphaera sp. PoT]|uniref:Crp/Fnr family transcriptional regulator n=1 Tax=Singulisphaera sp. PoT TaxID=3411797 RepID=UPI003BF4A5D9